MTYEQQVKVKHPVITAVANKAAEILHAAITPLWVKSATEEITPVDLKTLDVIVGILKDIQNNVDMDGEISSLSDADLLKKVQKMTKVLSK